jgi:hypothetical protein
MVGDNDPHFWSFAFGLVNSTQQTLIVDNFVGTNGTALPSHAIAPTNTPGTSWTAQNGSYTIQSNKSSTTGTPTGPGAVATCDCGQATCTVSATVNLASATGNAGVLARYAAGAFYMAQYSGSSNSFDIFEYNGSSFVSRATTAASIDSNNHAVVFSAAGSTLSATLDGGSLLIYGSASSNPSATVVGLRSNPQGSTNTVSNFQVTSP